MFINFLISAIGFVVAHRILANIVTEFALNQKIFIILNIFCVLALATSIFFVTHPLTLWILIGILLITLKFFPRFMRFFLLKRLAQGLIPFFDHVILGLQAGKSFRQAMNSAIEAQAGWQRNQLRDLYNSIVTSEIKIVLKSALLKDLQAELLAIDRSQNRCVEQVKALRRQLKLMEDFRRRSGQVTEQMKMQALIVTALYLGLLFFVIKQFGFKNHQSLILISGFIFLIGLLWIFLIGRRMKWKV